MKSDDWQKVKQVLDDVLALPAAERAAFLDRVAPRNTNTEVREEVERLLCSYDSAFMEQNAIPLAIDALSEPGLTTGHVIGRYKICELIGKGGMGRVFRADDTELDRSVAFKVLDRDVADDEERVRRFIQEAKAASALNHPNILTIHEVGSFEGSRFIVSELVDGATLRERMRGGLNVAESVEITCQIAAALKAAHDAGIVHRDIKPENVMIRRDGLVKVLDFGLAKLTEADDRPEQLRKADRGTRIESADSPLPSLSDLPHSEVSDPHLTAPGLVMGTVAYMSPEQANGQPVDSRTDLWSLGVVLHEMLTGHSAFDGDSVTELIASIVKKDTLPAHLETLPSELRPICEKALAKDKDSRYRSAHDLLNDLEGEKKRMEYAIDSKKYITVSSADERKTQLIGPRRTLSAEYVVHHVTQHKYLTLSVILAVMFAALGLTVYQYKGASQFETSGEIMPAITADTTQKDLKMSRLPTSDKVSAIAISPDGKFVAYVSGHENVNNPIRLRELQTGKETELVPAQSGVNYYELNFSPDGNFLDYAHDQTHISIYRVATSGGLPPIKIIEKSDGGGSISPDGKQLFFDRDNDVSEDFYTSDPDGKHERMVLNTRYKDQVTWVECDGVPAWSPDSKKVACERRYKQDGKEFYKLVSIDVADGSESEISETKWWDISGRVWLSNGDLVIVAKEATSDDLSPFQLWLISPGAQPKQITNGFAGFSGLTATRKGDILASVQPDNKSDVWILPEGDSSRATQITSSGELVGGFDFMPNGRIVFSSGVSGNADLWTMNVDGSDRRQLTVESADNRQPDVSPDGRYIVFRSTRNGRFRFDPHIFRMDADGGNVKQLTSGVREWFPRISRDGKWVYYMQVNEDAPITLCKVSIDGGTPSVLATMPEGMGRSDFLDVAPDGRIVYERNRWLNDHRERRLYVISPKGGPPLSEVRLPLTGTQGIFQWMPDGKSFAFNDTRNGQANIWTI